MITFRTLKSLAVRFPPLTHGQDRIIHDVLIDFFLDLLHRCPPFARDEVKESVLCIP